MKNLKTGEIRRMDNSTIASMKKLGYEQSEDENAVAIRNRSQNLINRFEVANNGQSVSGEIEQNQVTFANNRKMKINDLEYTNIGEESGLVRLYNAKTRKI